MTNAPPNIPTTPSEAPSETPPEVTPQALPRIPDRSQRVRETIRRFESSTDRPGTVLEISTPDLFDVGLLLSDRKLSTAEAWRQTNTLLGGSDEEPVVSRSTFYRFADRFKSLLGQVTAEHAQRIARLSVANATDGNIRDMTRLSRHRLVELMAEKLVSADDLEDIDKLLSRMSAVLADAERAQAADEKLDIEAAKLKLAVEQADQRERKLQSDLDLAEKRSLEIERRLTQAQQRFDAEMKTLAAKKSGKSIISDADIAEARRLVFGR